MPLEFTGAASVLIDLLSSWLTATTVNNFKLLAKYGHG